MSETPETVETHDTPETPDPPDPPATDEHDPSRPPVEALAQALVEHAKNAADVEATEKQMNGVAPATPTPVRAPRDRELPFGASRFNADQAVKTLDDKAEECDALKAEWETQKSLAADAKKQYDTAVESFIKITHRLRDEQRRQAHQPTLQDIEDGAEPTDTRPACPWEREHPGERCPVCSSHAAAAANGKGEGPSPESPEHPQHPDHEMEAESEVGRQLVELSQRLQPKRLHVTSAELAELGAEDLQTLREYSVAESCPVPPALLMQACVAALVHMDSSTEQHCTRCGALLWNRHDESPPYPTGDLVGLACAAASEAHVPADEGLTDEEIDQAEEEIVESAAAAPAPDDAAAAKHWADDIRAGAEKKRKAKKSATTRAKRR